MTTFTQMLSVSEKDTKIVASKIRELANMIEKNQMGFAPIGHIDLTIDMRFGELKIVTND